MSLQQITDFLKDNNTLDAINIFILAAEEQARKRIKTVKGYAEQYGVTVSIQEDSTIAKAVAEVTGFYCHPSYNSHFKSHTARFSEWHMLWYAVRDNIPDFYTLLNGELNGEKGTFKCKTLSFHRYAGGELNPIREFKNGYTIYEIDREFVEYLGMVYWLRDFFENRGAGF
jgi:hypothetical protein